MEHKTFRQILGDGIHKGLSAFWMLSKIMIPVYVVMTVLARTPVLARAADFCAPLMKFWGLPGDAAMAIILGMTINIYACIAATVALHLTPTQMTIVAVIIGISHNNILEGTILYKTGAPIGILVPMRIIAGLGLGWLVGVGFQIMN